MPAQSLDVFSQVLNALEAAEIQLTKLHIYIADGHCRVPFGDVSPVLDQTRRAIEAATE